MISRLTLHTRWIWLLCLVLLAVRIGGAHLHLCFDGVESAVAVHAGDLDVHDNHHDNEHVDADLNLIDSGVAKHISQPLNAPALLAAILVLSLLVRTHGAPLSAYRVFLPCFIPHRFSAPRAPPR